jgi:hypothetical protein
LNRLSMPGLIIGFNHFTCQLAKWSKTWRS